MVAAITYPITFFAVRGGNWPPAASPGRFLASIEKPRTVSLLDAGHPAEALRITSGPLCPECRARMRWVPGTANNEPRYECTCGFMDRDGQFPGGAA